MSFNDWQVRIHDWAIRKEWRGPKATPRAPEVDIALIHSEASEGLEELRVNQDPRHVWYSYDVTHNVVKFKGLTAQQVLSLTGKTVDELNLIPKPEGFGPELADIMIRILDTAEEHGLDMDYEVERKMQYNETREVRHGGKFI